MREDGSPGGMTGLSPFRAGAQGAGESTGGALAAMRCIVGALVEAHLSRGYVDMIKTRRAKRFGLVSIVSLLCGLCIWPAPDASARTVLRNICRVKGQEENVLRGLGLVVGLNGTGEANDPQTMRALARAMEVMGNPIPQTGLGH